MSAAPLQGPLPVPLADQAHAGSPQIEQQHQGDVDTEDEGEREDGDHERMAEDEDLDAVFRTLMGEAFDHIVDAGIKPCTFTRSSFLAANTILTSTLNT
jgi:hypothetical protein